MGSSSRQKPPITVLMCDSGEDPERRSALRLAWISCIFLLVTGLLIGCEEPKYPTDDAVAIFGDGRFQIARGQPKTVLELTDWGEDGGPIGDYILDVVFDWKEQGDWVYVYGKDGVYFNNESGPSNRRVYVVLNYKTARWSKFKRLMDVPSEHRAEAARLQTQRLPGR
jgi:hypothetical protein